MRLFEDIILTDSIEIKATPERIFQFFLHIVDDASYQAWHPEDHVGVLVRRFEKKKLEEGLSSARKHIKEEGENLKRILENDEWNIE